MPIDITIKDVVKRYGNNTVISGMNLKVKGGEFFTLLGPSGCGKTTLLRMIAGFNTIEGGDILFNDKVINDLDPSKRNIGMVFQNYAIFPHMTVRKNVEYGLHNRHLDKETIQEKTDRFLDLMQIRQFADRMPDALSGGQQQRVALARALVISPDVLLMDEPLSNLDAKLRVEMRSVIREIQNKMGITTVYVTHDQEEAMAVSDRIAVMNKGVIQQIGTSRELYQRPSNLFVATFIGRSNVLDGQINNGILTLHDGYSIKLDNLVEKDYQGAVKVSVRPEEYLLSPKNENKTITAIVDDSVFLGLNSHYFCHIQGTNEKIEIISISAIDDNVKKGDSVNLSLKVKSINVFGHENWTNLLKGVSNDQ
ncbi:MAG: ABC transporter ATP-binding protein [Bacilli bacterium]|jgi:iron(III) transport system ATP-binding protein|nr:ABC transporter ATP-binding protein [Bacilli bacterium]